MTISIETYNKLQLREIDRYIWCVGVNTNHDPLLDHDYNYYAIYWVSKYAAQYRVYVARHNKIIAKKDK